jgi:hypothetical protein
MTQTQVDAVGGRLVGGRGAVSDHGREKLRWVSIGPFQVLPQSAAEQLVDSIR